jgi:hypothetical protein
MHPKNYGRFCQMLIIRGNEAGAVAQISDCFAVGCECFAADNGLER